MREASHATGTETRIHRIPPTEARDAPLVLQEMAPAGGPVQKPPVILLHGATFASAMFDIPLPGCSLQHFLAVRGRPNFTLDVRGYGRSVPATVLDAPPEGNPPYARLDAAVDDLESGIRFVLRQTGSDAADVVAFSWGTIVACKMACCSPGLVSKLVLYAPLYCEVNDAWIDRIADPSDRTRVNPRLGSYRWIGESDIRARWDADIPDGASTADYRDDKVLHSIVETLAAADRGAKNGSEASFRAPTGALTDLFEIFNGRSLYDPACIGSPALIIRGHNDTTSTQSDALRLFNALGTTRKRYVEISPGSHFLCAEKNANELFQQIDLFLG